MIDAFCDADGNLNTGLLSAFWTIEFNDTSGVTMVSIEIKYESVADLEKYVEMCFKEGFTAGMENLDELLKS